MTPLQARTAARWLGRRSHKFNARRTPGAYNRTYDSAAEAAYSEELALLERAGEISDVECQLLVDLAGLTWRVDFAFTERGQRIWVEVKGVVTQRTRDVCKLWAKWGPGELRIIRRHRRGAFELIKTIIPNASAHTDQPRKVS